jgi:hypothetical protein
MFDSFLRRAAPAAAGHARVAAHTRRARLTALAAVTALAAGGGTLALASTAGAATAAAGARVPRCLEANLVTGLYGYETSPYESGQGGFILTLTNSGGTSCSLYGYPGLGLEDAQHHVVHSRTHWGSTYFAHDPGRHRIVLSPGETASASIGFVYTSNSNQAAHATYLEVTPPNAYNHAVIEIPHGVGQTSKRDLYVTAMARHTPWKGSTGACCQ